MTATSLPAALAVVRARLGLVVPEHAEAVVAAHLEARARGGASAEIALGELRRLPLDHPVLAALVARLTNGQTYFLRDEAVLDTVLGALPKAARTLRVWSAGCATGEEAYALAMLARERDLDVRITATDVCAERLAFAREGRYGEWSLRRVSPARRARFFVEDELGARVRPDLARCIEWLAHSITAAAPPSTERFDAILCRHVLIYLDPALHMGIAHTFCQALVRGGLVVLGVAERLPVGDADLVWVADGDVPAYSKGPPETGRFITRVGGSGLSERPSRGAPSLPPESSAAHAALPDPSPSGVLVRTAAEREDWVAALVAAHRTASAASPHDAVAPYRAVVDAHGAAAEPWYALGLAMQRAGDDEGARDALRSAVFLEPRMWRASLALGIIYARTGQPEAARRELERTVEVLSSTGRVVRHLAPSPDGELCALTDHEGFAAARARLVRLPKRAQP